jgi:hypothetical protein
VVPITNTRALIISGVCLRASRNVFVSIIVWSVRNVDNLIRFDKEGKLGGTYRAKQTNTLRDALKHTPEIINARVLVIGTTTPRV